MRKQETRHQNALAEITAIYARLNNKMRYRVCYLTKNHRVFSVVIPADNADEALVFFLKHWEGFSVLTVLRESQNTKHSTGDEHCQIQIRM